MKIIFYKCLAMLILQTTAFYFFTEIIFISFISPGAYNRRHFTSSQPGTYFYFADLLTILFSFFIVMYSKAEKGGAVRSIAYNVFVISTVLFFTVTFRYIYLNI